jgi:hypothetical protein
LRGLSFAEYSKLTGEPLRQVSFSPPTGSEALFRELPGLESFDANLEVLNLLKPVYGLRDAPKAWKVRLNQALEGLGIYAIPTDAGTYVLHESGRLCLVLTTHVDDLKCCGTPKARKLLFDGLTKQFGSLTEKCNTFEHCGLLHSRQGMSVIMSQSHYIKQLKLIDIITYDTNKPEAALTPVQLTQFQSLLGAVAWVCQTRADIAVYTQALQRNAHCAKVGHVLKLNKLVRWMRRKECVLRYDPMPEPYKILGLSDSAFRKEDPSALAMRGAVIGLVHRNDASASPSGTFHVYEFFSKKQRRVTRSTYGAELNSLADTYETSRVLSLTLAAILLPKATPKSLALLEDSGSLPVWIELATDCRSVFDSLAAAELKVPSEGSLVLLLHMIKEGLRSFNLRRVWWVDTTDMTADGLTKGAIARTALLQLSNTGKYNCLKPCKLHQEAIKVPITQHVAMPHDTALCAFYRQAGVSVSPMCSQ